MDLRALLCVVMACDSTAVETPNVQPTHADVGTAAPAGFGLYVLALTWAPSFCCEHPDKEQCANLTGAYAATHLTLHGLWPNYTDDEARSAHSPYPQFCGSYAHCKKHDASCVPDPSTIPDEMRTLGPGYVGDHDFLADHEWPKHGSCTGLAAGDYFRAALAAMKSTAHDDKLAAAIGGDIALADLESAFGVPKDSVLLSCDKQCRLSQVSFCLAHDARNVPTTPTTCPTNTTKAQYDNGCVTRGCQRVAIQAVGSCERSDRSDRPKTPRQKPKGACTHPGQGPQCANDADCSSAGYKRCARSGRCTNQP
jgi:ribonuclease T2